MTNYNNTTNNSIGNNEENTEEDATKNDRETVSIENQTQDLYTNSNCLIKKSSAEAQAKHNLAIHLANKQRLDNSYNASPIGSNINTGTRAGVGSKFFADCPKLSSNTIQDKFLVITKTAGEDYNISYSEFIGAIKKDLLRPALKEQIGHMHFNTSNHLNLRDNPSYKTEYFEYLMLDGRELKTKDYPELAEYLYAGGKESFNLPNMQDGTIRNIRRGTGRANGTFEEDSFKSHVHNNKHKHRHEHKHNLPDIRGQIRNDVGTFTNPEGAFSAEWGKTGSNSGSQVDATSFVNFSSYRAGVTTTNGITVSNGNAEEWTENYIGDTQATGDNETRMKNMGVQAYICSKVLI